ncbi:MAG TPA: M1 family aminopeptidase [Terracidiphilus sp.]|nr:M1 family aminopeptidase [Terracidiphilus sp.]
MPSEPGVSRTLAIDRAGRLSKIHYQLSFAIREHEAAVDGTESLSFDSKTDGDLLIDYRDGILHSAELNGRPISPQIENGHLKLPASTGKNKVKLVFTSNAAAAGKAITRYEDKDDGSEYFYTLFVPMDASMAFPCFDQPDLKANFRLDVEHPAHWTVIGNTAATLTDETHTSFEETRPISTYLFAFAAGPFEAVRSKNAAEPTVYVRKSQMARAEQEAPQVQQMAARGIGYFSEFFAQPFPFPKYDLVLIPGFPFGGMEHAGATFLNEDGILFRSMPTPSDFFRRNTLVLHETCHQWFGDLVTMRWFDDLWLKEGFAQYMAYKGLASLEPASNPWKHFYDDVKPLAYGIDETLGTTPIYQDIPNLKDAKSAYGAIVYQKAPAILKQLEFRIGSDAFRAGLRTYLSKHAYGNAEWSDLIAAFGQAIATDRDPSATSKKVPDLDAWAAAWIKRRGMPQIDVDWSCRNGKVDRLTLSQHDVLPDGFAWPISTQVMLNYGPEDKPNRLFRVDWSTAAIKVSQALGQACPAFVFANAGDEAYGRFPLDSASEAEASRQIVSVPLDKQEPLLRAMLWGALWDNVHLAKSPPRGYVELAVKSLPDEVDDAMARVQGGRISTALHSWMSEDARKAVLPHVESVIADRMFNAPTLGMRIVSFRTFTSISETPDRLQKVKELLAGKVGVPGMELKRLDRWNLVGHLVAMSDPEAKAIYEAEKAHDQSGEGLKYAYAAEAATPSAEVKERYFNEYLHSPTIQEDWITQSLRPFNAWNQAWLTQQYLVQALDELEKIKQHRKIFFLGAWLGAFIGGQDTLENSVNAKTAVQTWLTTHQIDPDLRRKILEAADALNRTGLIRKTYPN